MNNPIPRILDALLPWRVRLRNNALEISVLNDERRRLAAELKQLHQMFPQPQVIREKVCPVTFKWYVSPPNDLPVITRPRKRKKKSHHE